MNYFEKYSKKPWLLYEVVSGSRAYNLHHENSDVDIRGVYVADLMDEWSLNGAPEGVENKVDGNDTDYWELRKYIRLLCGCNPNIIETLYINDKHVRYIDNQFMSKVRENRHQFITKKAKTTFLGYAYAQMKKFEKSFASGNGTDWKNAMHCMRLLHSARNIFVHGEPVVEVDKQTREWLLYIKSGAVPFEEYKKTYDLACMVIEDLAGISVLPEEVNNDFVNNLLIELKWYYAAANNNL